MKTLAANVDDLRRRKTSGEWGPSLVIMVVPLSFSQLFFSQLFFSQHIVCGVVG
jgi:hypothetical protein